MLHTMIFVGRIVAFAGALATAAVLSERSSVAAPGPSADDNLEFQRALGDAIFRKTWVSAPASTDSSDGLGPLFNARACSTCHPRGGRGRPASGDGAADRSPALVLRLSVPPVTLAERQRLANGVALAIPEPTYGLQLQTNAIQGHASEGQLRVTYTDQPVRLGDGASVVLHQPSYSIDRLGYGPLHPGTLQSPRLAPALIGLGLLEAVPDTEILAFEDPDDRNGDGISGRASRVGPVVNGARAIGRFGWKAGHPTVRAQVAEAFAIDMGLSSAQQPLPAGDCTPRQTLCRAAPDGGSARHGGHEVGDTVLDLVTSYVTGIAPPPGSRSSLEPSPSLEPSQGQRLFEQAQCALCHRPALKTGRHTQATEAAAGAIRPYTDLLLHDMGAGLADHRPEGAASGSEWRTAPLWGIGQSLDVAGRGHLLHDGRAGSIEEAILWHGGEAQAARDAFAALPRADRDRLIQFVRSL